jgi:uncharacterized phage protein (TIGR01671 family)
MTEQNLNTEPSNSTKPVLANRLFKFRAWVKEQKRMIKVFGFNEHLVFEQTWDSPSIKENIFEIEDCHIMQFTGFTDKKEVEIYQGDICKYHKNTSKWLVSYHFEVKFKNGAFYAYWEREMMGKLEQHWDLLSQKDMRNIRVVSDIFQSAQTTS